MSSKNFTLFGHRFWKAAAGEISERPAWCCYYGGYLHVHESFWGLLKEVLREHRHDRHMVG